MSYADRLKDLQDSWKNDKADAGGGVKLPEGSYQAKIATAKPTIGKKGKRIGHVIVDIKMTVVAGKLAGKSGFTNYDLNQPSSNGFPSGIARFKGLLEMSGVAMPKKLSEKSLKTACAGLLDSVYDIGVKHNGQYVNMYINRLVHSDDEVSAEAEEEFESEDDLEETEVETEDEETEEDDDGEDEEEEEGEDDESDEESEEEEEEDDSDDPEPEPIKKKLGKKAAAKAAKKKGKKKAKITVTAEDTDDDDDEFGEW